MLFHGVIGKDETMVEFRLDLDGDMLGDGSTGSEGGTWRKSVRAWLVTSL